METGKFKDIKDWRDWPEILLERRRRSRTDLDVSIHGEWLGHWRNQAELLNGGCKSEIGLIRSCLAKDGKDPSGVFADYDKVSAKDIVEMSGRAFGLYHDTLTIAAIHQATFASNFPNFQPPATFHAKALPGETIFPWERLDAYSTDFDKACVDALRRILFPKVSQKKYYLC